MSQVFCFEEDHAEKYGVQEAIVLYHLRHWIELNHASGRNRKENRTWTYQSQKAVLAHFSFFTKHQIEHIFVKLTGPDGPLVKGNFNGTKYDRTTWYAFKDEEVWIREKYRKIPKCISEISEMENGDSRNRFPQIPEPIPDKKTDIYTHMSTTPTPPKNSEARSFEVMWKKMKEKFGEALTEEKYEAAWNELKSIPPREIKSVEGLLSSIVEKYIICAPTIREQPDPNEREDRILRHRQQAISNGSDNVWTSEYCVYFVSEQGTCPVSYDCSDEEWEANTGWKNGKF